jgi:hypothetical protein
MAALQSNKKGSRNPPGGCKGRPDFPASCWLWRLMKQNRGSTDAAVQETYLAGAMQ